MTSRIDAHALVAKVRANAEMLRQCPRHDFQPIPDTLATPIRRRYRCTVCGGEVDSHAHFWYSRGLEDGKAAP